MVMDCTRNPSGEHRLYVTPLSSRHFCSSILFKSVDSILLFSIGFLIWAGSKATSLSDSRDYVWVIDTNNLPIYKWTVLHSKINGVHLTLKVLNVHYFQWTYESHWPGVNITLLKLLKIELCCSVPHSTLKLFIGTWLWCLHSSTVEYYATPTE